MIYIGLYQIKHLIYYWFKGTQLNVQHEKKDTEADDISTVDYTEWAMGKIKDLHTKNLDNIPQYLEKIPKLITSGLSFEEAVTKYITLHQQIFGKQSSFISTIIEKIQNKAPIRGFPGL